MSEDRLVWNELKARFLREFTRSEQLFFLRTARELVNEKGYPVSEDLFNSCYFLTLLERLRLIEPQGCEGFTRFMLVQSRRELQEEAKACERRLQAGRLPVPDRSGARLLEYLAS